MEKEVIRVAKKAIETAIVNELTGYNKPLSKYVVEVIEDHKDEIKDIIDGAVVELITLPEFKKSFTKAVNTKLAKILVNKMGGELEKKVNELKQDPVSRARITVALDKLMEEVCGEEK